MDGYLKIFKNASGLAVARVCGAVGYGAAWGEPKLLVELVLSPPGLKFSALRVPAVPCSLCWW